MRLGSYQYIRVERNDMEENSGDGFELSAAQVDIGCTRFGRSEFEPSSLFDLPSHKHSDDFLDGGQSSSLRLIWSSITDPHVPRSECARHVLISIRLQKAYFAYCLLCFAVSVVVFASTFHRFIKLTKEGRDIVSHQWLPWETLLESVIGFAVCVETVSTLWLVGRRAFVRDLWCILDGTVTALTLLNWFLLFLKRVFIAYDMLEIDLPLLAFRFMMQPCRVIAAVSMLRRVNNMQQSHVDIDLCAMESSVASRFPQNSCILTPALHEQICDHLPAWCRFRDWRLAYSPDFHGTSMQTFLRRQQGGGANVIVIRDARGCVFGGFITEEWRLNTQGYHGSSDCFVFTAPPLPVSSAERWPSPQRRPLKNLSPRSPRPDPSGIFGNEAGRGAHEDTGCLLLGSTQFFRATGGSVLLWCDGQEISLGGALHLRDDFRRGSTMESPAFASPALTAQAGADSGFTICDAGVAEFAIRHFECWQFISVD